MLKKLENRYLARYYKSIEDIPVYNWWKLHEENDFKYLLKDSKNKTNNRAEKVVKSIKDEFINTFGVDKKYEEYLNLVWKLEVKKIEIAITGDRSKKIFADMLEIDIEDLLNEKEVEVHNHGLMHIEKYMGFRLDVKTTTVFEFYSYVKDIEKQLKHA